MTSLDIQQAMLSLSTIPDRPDYNTLHPASKAEMRVIVADLVAGLAALSKLSEVFEHETFLPEDKRQAERLFARIVELQNRALEMVMSFGQIN